MPFDCAARDPEPEPGRDAGPGRPGALHFETTGGGTDTPVVLLHGFTQTGRLWGPLAEDLAADRQVIAVDLPGHGGSSEVEADLWEAADLVADVIAAAAEARVGGVDVVGYSLGARLALHLALAHPALVRRMVLVGGTAGFDDPNLRTERRVRDEDLAASLLGTKGRQDRVLGPDTSGSAGQDDAAGGGVREEAVGEAGQDDAAGGGVREEAPGGSDGAHRTLEEFLDRWLAGPLFAGLPASAADRKERLRNTPAGLASSLRLSGAGSQEPLWDRLGEIGAPTLVIAGTADSRFTALGQRLVTGIGSAAELCLVLGATHAAHLHQPRATALRIRAFLGNGANARQRDEATESAS